MTLLGGTREEVQNMWTDAINRSLTIDRLLANKSKYGAKALKKATILLTWRGTLSDEKTTGGLD
ncbi:hypothetical protein DFS33DRAFT_1351818 [Desarmillaria ectypa]|nr:hypothetical protein DFS33DRAFT_1351818 [Desarmillaria ectypa]